MLKKLNYIFNRGQKIHLLFLFFAFLIGSGLELVGVSAILPLVNVIVDPTILQTNQAYAFAARLLHATDARSFVFVACIGLIVIYVLKNLYLLFMYHMQFRYTYNNKARISSDLMAIYVSQDYLTLIEHNVANLERSINVDVELFFALVLALLNILCEGCTALVLVAFVFVSAPEITIALIVIMTVFGLGFTKFFKKKLAITGEKIRERSALKGKWFLQTFSGIKEIKVLSREDFFKKNYQRANFACAEASREQSLNQVITRPVIETACIGGLLAIVAARVWTGAPLQSFVPILSVFVVAAMRLLPSFNRIMSNASSVMASLPALDALYNDMKNAEKMRKNSIHQDGHKIVLYNEIQISHVTFTYPHKTEPVLQDVSFVIPKNKSVAFIGPSGAGKTTMADIILGLMEPQEGRILADDINVYRNLVEWHDVVAYIPQSIYLMDDTILANILFGLPEENADEKKVWQALREAQLEDFVRQQPEGLLSRVGDRGVKLSGGQRQRIGIARALYHDPQVLILDEATSALDTDTETAVMEAINSLQGSKTLIIIAHRLTTIRNCDIIYEVRNGKVTTKTKEEVFEHKKKSE